MNKTLALTALLLSTTAGAGDVSTQSDYTYTKINEYVTSKIYPEKWRSLPDYDTFDFSRAGYLSDGMQAVQGIPENLIDVTDSAAIAKIDPELKAADNSGQSDAAPVINAVINYIGEQGGGTVYLPAGTYLLRPTVNATAITISHDNIHLKGDGDSTVLKYELPYSKTNTTATRLSRFIKARPTLESVLRPRPEVMTHGGWAEEIVSGMRGIEDQVDLLAEIIEAEADTTGDPEKAALAAMEKPVVGYLVGDSTGTNRITVSGLAAGDLTVGQRLVIGGIANDAYARVHGMHKEVWGSRSWDGKIPAPTYFREVVSINTNPDNNTYFDIELDNILSYEAKAANNLKVIPLRDKDLLDNVIVSDLVFRQNLPSFDGYAGKDYNYPGRAAHAIHDSALVEFEGVYNGVIENTKTQKWDNSVSHHIASNGFILSYTRNVTIRNNHIGRSRYIGEGGNGYGITIQSNDSLIYGNELVDHRHPVDFKSSVASGNVLFANNVYATYSHYSTLDFHLWLSFDNLIDTTGLANVRAESYWRPFGSSVLHGWPSTRSIFWNTYKGEQIYANPYAVTSDQFGEGWVVGTRGLAATTWNTNASKKDSIADTVEARLIGEQLWPTSLYLEQLSQRKSGLPAPRYLVSGEQANRNNQFPAMIDGLGIHEDSLNWYSLDRYSATLDVDFHGIREVSGIRVAMNLGDKRSSKIVVQRSDDGEVWQDVLDNHYTALADFETIYFDEDITTRYLRVIFGQQSSGWVNVKEIEFLAEPVTYALANRSASVNIDAAKPAAIIKGEHSHWALNLAGDSDYPEAHVTAVTDNIAKFDPQPAHEQSAELVYLVDNLTSQPLDYRIWLRGRGLNNQSDSVHITVGNEAPLTAQAATLKKGNTPGWESDVYGPVDGQGGTPKVTLQPGRNQVRLLIREANASVDTIRLSSIN
ncbi:MAG: discoidin domain-containing protein [Gammaproteobacteria bacterium]|nr:discoidin domain-containing protein [Gammaproteobacteria bacterium]